MTTGLPRADVDAALASLMADERVQVAVSEPAVVVYRIDQTRALDASRALAPPSDGGECRPGSPPARTSRPASRRWRRRSPDRRSHRVTAFDAKTLRLIHARGGVVSLAELVEHTGLTVAEARRDAERLAELYGGEPHPSWDGHVVYAFPDLVESAHGAFHVREPRPAWVRAEDPTEERRGAASRGTKLGWVGLGATGAAALTWLASFPPPPGGRALVLATVAGASVTAAFGVTRALLHRIARHPSLRLRRAETVRRYVLGYVFETALRGKGVVSLDRTVSYLRMRTGDGRVHRRTVERALRRLAEEFEAPVTELHGDLFFGFRNVKRQFLASQVQRARLRLERRAVGPTLYDSGESELAAARRELDDFDRVLRSPAPPGRSR